MRRAERLIALFAALLLGACRVDVKVAVVARDDGTGNVAVTATLDQEAAEAVGGADGLAAELREDGLVAAGWSLAEPVATATGQVRVTATHRFTSPDGAVAALNQVAGGDGPLRDVRLTQRRSWWRTETGFAATVDLVDGIDAFSDPELLETLGLVPLSSTFDQLDRQLERDPAASGGRVALDVAVSLPGGERRFAVAAGESRRLRYNAATLNVRTLALVGVSAAAALTFLFVLVYERRAIARRSYTRTTRSRYRR